MEYIKQNFNKIILLMFAALAVLITYMILEKSPILHRQNAQQEQNATEEREEVRETANNAGEDNIRDQVLQVVREQLADHKNELPQLIHDYILNNPEVLIKSLESLQSKKFSQKIKHITSDPALYLGKSPVVGNKAGDIKILAFIDYACGYCKKADAVLTKLIAEDKDVQVIYEYVATHGPESEYAIKAAMATSLKCPEFFGTVHQALMSMTDLNIENVRNMMISQKLPLKDLDQEINDPVISDDLQRVANLTSILAIRGTPVFIVNDRFLVGFIELEQLQQIIKDLRSQTQTAK